VNWRSIKSWVKGFGVPFATNSCSSSIAKATTESLNLMTTAFRMESSDCFAGESADEAAAAFQEASG